MLDQFAQQHKNGTHLPADSDRCTWMQIQGSAAPSVMARPTSASPTAASTASPLRVLDDRLLAKLRLLNTSSITAVLPVAATLAARPLRATCCEMAASNSSAKSSVSGWNSACE